MSSNAWILALAGAGLISLPAVACAEEKPSSLLTGLASTTVSGYVDTSAQWNPGTGNANTPPYAFGGTARADGFNLNVVKLSLEKPSDAKEEWGARYKVDLLFGPDANALATQSSGNAADFGVRPSYQMSPQLKSTESPADCAVALTCAMVFQARASEVPALLSSPEFLT